MIDNDSDMWIHHEHIKTHLQVDPTRILHAFAPNRWVLLMPAIIWMGMWQLKGAAPAVLWSTNVSAYAFAVDTQTNVYATTNGNVIVVNALGQTLRTNSICPLHGWAQRDSAGNYYFAGLFNPPKDFGGVTLTQGKCYLAKYTEAGALLWAVMAFDPGDFYRGLSVTDLQIDTEGNAYVGITYFVSTMDHTDFAIKFNSAGSNVWRVILPHDFYLANVIGKTRFGTVTPTNGYVLGFKNNSYQVTLFRFDSSGTPAAITSWLDSSDAFLATRPIANSKGEVYQMQGGRLTKWDAQGSLIWDKPLTAASAWTLGDDLWDGVHLATANHELIRCSSDGTPAWTITFPANCLNILMDAGGNRFVALNGGGIARLGQEQFTAPAIQTQPQGLTVLTGSNVLMQIQATGSSPMSYFWYRDDNLLAGTSNTLFVPGVTLAQAGSYSVVVSNLVGCVTSAPAVLRVKNVALFSGNQLLTNGTYAFETPPGLSIQSTYANGAAFYTLDGSAPTFSSTFYTGPFTLTQSARVRVIAYSADFMQSEEADAPDITVLVRHSLSTYTAGGGTINLSPPGGLYTSTSMVTLTAVPSAGWSFLCWLGDNTGTNPVLQVQMDQDKTFQAVFGTSISTTVAGNGQVLLDPPVGPYPYGKVVRVTAIAQPGNYFGFWGNAATGNTNPLCFRVSNPNPSISSIFAPTPEGQAALTVQINGNGSITVDPRANVYALHATVTITAIPEPGQTFLNWSGDAAGGENPLNVSMNQNRIITANFGSRPMLRIDGAGEGRVPVGIRFSLQAAANSVWAILASTNLTTWDTIGTVTSLWDRVQFTDPNVRNYRFYKAVSRP